MWTEGTLQQFIATQSSFSLSPCLAMMVSAGQERKLNAMCTACSASRYDQSLKPGEVSKPYTTRHPVVVHGGQCTGLLPHESPCTNLIIFPSKLPRFYRNGLSCSHKRQKVSKQNFGSDESPKELMCKWSVNLPFTMHIPPVCIGLTDYKLMYLCLSWTLVQKQPKENPLGICNITVGDII